MKYYLTIWMALILNIAFAQVNSIDSKSKVLDDFEKEVQREITEGKIAGAAYILFHDSKVVRKKAFGEAEISSQKKMQTNSIFRIASMTKPLASLALLLLQEDGLLNMNDRLDHYLPNFSNPSVVVKIDTIQGTPILQTQSAKNPILLRHLLTHTAGFASEYGGVLGNLYKETFKDAYLHDLDHYSTQLALLPLNHEPGENWIYGPSINVAARVIEVVSGMKFQEFLQKRILDPLEMTDTQFYLNLSDEDRLTALYTFNENGKLNVRDSGNRESQKIKNPKVYYSGSGGLSSTLDDYLKFCVMVLNNGVYKGKPIANPETISLMKMDQVPLNINADMNEQPGQLTEGFTFGYQIVRKQNAKSLKSQGAISWSGATGPIFFIDPAKRLIGIYMFQLQPNSQIISRKTFADWMIKSINP
jgi:CubicO group peptidase (beta-lactamase class C family)